MIIDGNEKEKEAMIAFHRGNRAEGLKLQEKFAAQFREEYGDFVYNFHCNNCRRLNSEPVLFVHLGPREYVILLIGNKKSSYIKKRKFKMVTMMVG